MNKNHRFSGDSLEESIKTGIRKIDSLKFGMKFKTEASCPPQAVDFREPVRIVRMKRPKWN